jgi:hypothetical protein
MTTSAQIKRLVKPLLARHESLVQVGPWIYLKPIRHVARAIVIDRTGGAARFRPIWTVMHIIEPIESLSLIWSRRLGHPINKLWLWDDPTIQDALIDVFERQVVPLLGPIETLDDFVAFADDKTRFTLDSLHAFLLRAAVVDAARGDLESAKAMCAKVATGKTQWSGPLSVQTHARVMGKLYPLLLSDDRAGIVKLLREWEAFSVKHLGLEAVWERTPFPLELQTAS